MPKDITIMGASYTGVPSIKLPQTGGGQAQFFDVSGVTASASDVATGKKFMDANGVLKDGTGEMGGGGYEVESVDNGDGTQTLVINGEGGGSSSGGGDASYPESFHRVKKIMTGMVWLTEDSTSITVEHGLGEVPQYFAISPQGWVSHANGMASAIYLGAYSQLGYGGLPYVLKTTVMASGSTTTLMGSVNREPDSVTSDSITISSTSSSVLWKANRYRWVAIVYDDNYDYPFDSDFT